MQKSSFLLYQLKYVIDKVSKGINFKTLKPLKIKQLQADQGGFDSRYLLSEAA